MLVLVLLVALIALSAYFHRKGMTRNRRLTLVASWVAVVLVAGIAFTASANAAGVRCTRFVPANFIGPIPAGTCHLAPTKTGSTGWRGNPITGYHKDIWIRVGNQTTVKVSDAAERGIRDLVMAAGCGALATKYPAAGAACVAVIGAYFYMLQDTFKNAADTGRCGYFEVNGVRPVNYHPVAC